MCSPRRHRNDQDRLLILDISQGAHEIAGKRITRRCDEQPEQPREQRDQELTADVCTASAVAAGGGYRGLFHAGDAGRLGERDHARVHPNAGDPVPSVLSISWYIANGDDSGTLSGEGVSTHL